MKVLMGNEGDYLVFKLLHSSLWPIVWHTECTIRMPAIKLLSTNNLPMLLLACTKFCVLFLWSCLRKICFWYWIKGGKIILGIYAWDNINCAYLINLIVLIFVYCFAQWELKHPFIVNPRVKLCNICTTMDHVNIWWSFKLWHITLWKHVIVCNIFTNIVYCGRG